MVSRRRGRGYRWGWMLSDEIIGVGPEVTTGDGVVTAIRIADHLV